jgi:excisionase family DNA binding protein
MQHAPDRPVTPIERGAYSIKEFCEWASVSRTTVYREMVDGRLKSRKVRGRTLILKSDAETWLHSLPANVAA